MGATNKVWDKEAIVRLLETNDQAVIRALMAVYRNQTTEERQVGATVEHNGKGFTGFDGEVLTSLAEFYKKSGFLTPKQLDMARKKLPKYWKQLLQEAQKNGYEVSMKVKRQKSPGV